MFEIPGVSSLIKTKRNKRKATPRQKTPLYTRPAPTSDSFRAKNSRAVAKRAATDRAAKRRRENRTDALIANKPDVAQKLGVDTNLRDGYQRPKGRPLKKKTVVTTPKGTTKSSPKVTRVPTTTGTAQASSSPVVTPSGTRGTTVATKKNKQGGKKKGKNTSKTSTTKTSTTVTEDINDPVTTMFNAARRTIDRQQQVADAQRLRALEDQKAFDTWVSQQRGNTATALAAEFQRTAADAQAARDASMAAIQQYANNAALQAGGHADMLAAAGANANAEAFGFRQGAVNMDSAGGAFTQAALAQRNAAMSEADRARAANLLAGYNADYRKQIEDLNKQRSQLSVEEIKARQQNKQAERQYQLDQQAAQFLQGLRQGELGVKQFEAQTERLKVKAQATAAQAALQFKQQGLSLQQAKLEWQKQMDLEGITQKEKDRKLRALTAKWKLQTTGGGKGGAAAKARQSAVKYITQWNKDNLAAQELPAAPRGDAGIAYARSAVQALRGFMPNMRSEQALSILSGFLPGDVIRDNRIWTAIRDSFK